MHLDPHAAKDIVQARCWENYYCQTYALWVGEEWDKITIEKINKEIEKLPSIMAHCIVVNRGNNL